MINIGVKIISNGTAIISTNPWEFTINFPLLMKTVTYIVNKRAIKVRAKWWNEIFLVPFFPFISMAIKESA